MSRSKRTIRRWWRHRYDEDLKSRVDKHTYLSGLNSTWSDIDSKGRKFARLRKFVSNLATIFANTASIEGDFSNLKWEKDQFRSDLSHLSLEGILQAKQLEVTSKLYAMLHG